MQSTGQTSTQALSFTLMHGSAMMYGIQNPPLERSAVKQTGVVPKFTHRVKHSAHLAAIRASSYSTAPPQAVAGEDPAARVTAYGAAGRAHHAGIFFLMIRRTPRG